MTGPGQRRKKCDICIIGAGPASLAALSALQEPYTLDSMNDTQLHYANQNYRHKKRSICVVDPHPTWLRGWQHNFQILDIEFLRSPALAHPDHFDMNALLAYAIANNREKDELVESGCLDNRTLLALGQTQIGLWKLPSTSLFVDFCIDLSKRLSHDYVQGQVVDVGRGNGDGNGDGDGDDTNNDDDSKEDEDEPFTIKLSDEREIVADSVILALGPTGTPIIPPPLRNVPSQQMFSWTCIKDKLQPCHKSVLVVGGGLTAVQVAQQALRQGKNVMLCSRRPLIERHFDIGEEWLDRRTARKSLSDFYHQPEHDRLAALKEARGGGGSVPPIYMNDLRKWQKSGKLRIITGEPTYIAPSACDEDIKEEGHGHGPEQEQGNGHVSSSIAVHINGKTERFCCIILACGIQPDCTTNPLIQKIQQKWPTKIVGGLPSVTLDLEWKEDLPIHVVGALGGLNTGPDAGNIMGMRRAAEIVSNALGGIRWLEEQPLVRGGSRFAAFYDSDSDSDSDSETDSDGSDEDDASDSVSVSDNDNDEALEDVTAPIKIQPSSKMVSSLEEDTGSETTEDSSLFISDEGSSSDTSTRLETLSPLTLR